MVISTGCFFKLITLCNHLKPEFGHIIHVSISNKYIRLLYHNNSSIFMDVDAVSTVELLQKAKIKMLKIGYTKAL